MNQSLIFLGLGIGIQSASLIVQKFGLNHMMLKPWEAGNYLPNFIALALNPWIFLSVIGSFIGLGFWLVALSKMEISVAYPMVSLGYVITMIAGYFLFGEPITPVKILGAFLIIAGVFCLSKVV